MFCPETLPVEVLGETSRDKGTIFCRPQYNNFQLLIFYY